MKTLWKFIEWLTEVMFWVSMVVAVLSMAIQFTREILKDFGVI